MTKIPSKADSLARRIQLHEDRIRKLKKRLEVVEDVEIVGNIENDMKHFKGWYIDKICPGNIYRLTCDVRNKRYGVRKSLQLCNVNLIVTGDRHYGSSHIMVESESISKLWEFVEKYGITNIHNNIYNPTERVKALAQEIEYAKQLKGEYDGFITLFSTRLKQEKN